MNASYATNFRPTLFLTDTPRARTTDPLTSHAAADSNRTRLAVEATVLDLLTTRQMTDDELTVAYFLTYNHAETHHDGPRKRRSDLAKKGLVVATDHKRETHSGRKATVWTVA